MNDFTKVNLDDVKDSAPDFGYGAIGEARFVREALDATDTGVAFHRLNPGKRQGFGHRHDRAEEVAVVVCGSGRMKVSDEIVDLRRLDAVRLAPSAARAFEAGPDGMELLVFGPHHAKDGELLQDFWPAD